MQMKACATGIRALVGLAVLLVGGVGASRAGPARYDPETRSIRLTYTYASLPEGRAGAVAPGAPQRPSPEQDALVRSVVSRVSDVLSVATSGRLRVARLDAVPGVGRSDLVISLTGDPSRGGWAIAGAFEGRPGQVGLYYSTLAREWEAGAVVTAAHEVCHYVFGLADEYTLPGGCPPHNLAGPGCLMDNALPDGSRHGWYGRFCAADHDRQASQRPSCQEIVETFFHDRGVSESGSATAALDQRRSVIHGLRQATVEVVRLEAETRNRTLQNGETTSVVALREPAKRYFLEQLARNNVTLPVEETAGIIDGVLARAASLVALRVPARFGPYADLLTLTARTRSSELPDHAPGDSQSARRRQIVQTLDAFAAGLGTPGALTLEQRRYLENLAAKADTQTEEQRNRDATYRQQLAFIRHGRQVAGAQPADDLNSPLPGRPAAADMGSRHTLIVAPDPADPQRGLLLLPSGLHRYSEARDQFVKTFTSLVTRGHDPTRVSVLFERAGRETAVPGLLDELATQLQQDRADNVVVLVPPGGLPGSATAFEAIRRPWRAAGEPRLDVVTVAATDVSSPLRDLAAATGGSILAMADSSEVGAVAQQLARDQTSGAWVILPFHGVLEGLHATEDAAWKQPWLVAIPGSGTAASRAFEEACVDLNGRLAAVVAYFGHLQPGSKHRDRVELEHAAVLPLDAIDAFARAASLALQGDPATGRGLVDEVGYLHDAVAIFNARPADPAEALELDLMEHILRARSRLTRIDDLIAETIAALTAARSPVYDEQKLLRNADSISTGAAGPPDEAANDQKLARAASLEAEAKRHNEQAATARRKVADLSELFADAAKDPQGLIPSKKKELTAAADQLTAEARSKREQAAQLRQSVASRPKPPALQRIDGAIAALRVELGRQGQLPGERRYNDATRVTIALREQEMQLRAAHAFLSHLEGDLADLSQAPLFERVDRQAPRLASGRNHDQSSAGVIGLPRFLAESPGFDPRQERAEFELIVGLSAPLPGSSGSAPVLPELRLDDENGQPVNATSLELAREISSPTCLVYRLRPEPAAAGWYHGSLLVSETVRCALASGSIRFTFSVASTRPNLRLGAAQVKAGDRQVRVEAQVYGGTSIRGARVQGFFERLDRATGPIEQEFFDDGKTCGDATAGDGVYTATLSLDPSDPGKAYRMLIQAESTSLSRTIAPEDPMVGDDQRRKNAANQNVRFNPGALDPDAPPTSEPATPFQRATLLQIDVGLARGSRPPGTR